VRVREADNFTVVFYGLRIFCCKTAQLYDARRKSTALDSALKYTLRNVTKNCAKLVRQLQIRWSRNRVIEILELTDFFGGQVAKKLKPVT